MIVQGGGVTLCYQIVMLTSTSVVGCLLKKGLLKGGHGHHRTPSAMLLLVCRDEVLISECEGCTGK